MEQDYDHVAIEERWMTEWISGKLWSVPDLPTGDKRYTVTMYPYPSGDMHMGHVEIFTIHDAIARFFRMQGFQVMNPIGFDSFGLPAENAAIQRGLDPKEWTYSNIDKLYSSAQRIGCSFDWERTIATSDPEYFRWNQWFFLKFYERGLAYKKAAPANWCPNDKTVLANEQVVAGRCERCGAEVTKRYMSQWFFKVTDYADRLLDDMVLNEGWTERLKTLQSNWIGRSFGAEVDFDVDGGEPITVYTTRPDTLWGATFFVIAPEHPLAEELVAGTEAEGELEAFRDQVAKLTEIDRTSTQRPKNGMFTGRYALNPVNGERIPIWLADYVLMDYGTGAIMAVPAHDQRDLDFARRYDLPVRVVIEPPGGGLDEDVMTEAYSGPGTMVNSGPFDGTPIEDSVKAVTDWLETEGRGRHAKNFRIRDWLISRQRYWGTPIPIVFCDVCGEVPLAYEDLPLELPDSSGVEFNAGEGESPLATAAGWVNVACPKCGGEARRETDTMDTFVDSSWYFHRYLDPHNDEAPFDPAKSDAWMPIDQYTGGIEHAVMHLIYARFFQKVLMDMGMAKDPEPFPHLLNQGLITMGGKRMSKSRGNIVEPQEAFERFGADSLRVFMLFSGPPEANFDWPPEGVDAIGPVAYGWLKRVWRLCEETRAGAGSSSEPGAAEGVLRTHLHRTIKAVTGDFEAFSFNTAISRLHELVNEAYRYRSAGGADAQVLEEVVETLLKLLAPIAPYLTEEQWHRRGHTGSIHLEPWPAFDPSVAALDQVTMVVQVNGKVRDTIEVPADVTEERMTELALASPKVQAHLNGDPKKVIVKPPKMISLVA